MENLEEIIMNLIVDSGSARSYAMEAIQLAKNHDFNGAEAAFENCNEDLLRAHQVQTELIQNEAKGNKTEINLFLVHAQDHIMNAMVVRDLAAEIVVLYKKLKADKP